MHVFKRNLFNIFFLNFGYNNVFMKITLHYLHKMDNILFRKLYFVDRQGAVAK